MKRDKKTENVLAGPNENIDAITRKIAIAIAFISVFYFFIKLLFL